MKRSLKVLLSTVALTVLCVTPVFATETTLSAESAMLTNKMNGYGNDMQTLLSYDNNCGGEAVNAMHHLQNITSNDVKASNIAEQQNYIAYLQACVGNAIETERIKKQNVDSLTDLCKVNPTFKPQLDAAVVEYNKAVLDHQAANQAVVDAQAYFVALNQAFVNNALAKAAVDAQAILK